MKCICAPDGNVIRQLQDEILFVVHSSDGLSHFGIILLEVVTGSEKRTVNWLH